MNDSCELDPRHSRQVTDNNGCEQNWNNQICVCGTEVGKPEDPE